MEAQGAIVMGYMQARDSPNKALLVARPVLTAKEQAAACSYYAKVMVDSCEKSHGSFPGMSSGLRFGEQAGFSHLGLHADAMHNTKLIACISHPELSHVALRSSPAASACPQSPVSSAAATPLDSPCASGRSPPVKSRLTRAHNQHPLDSHHRHHHHQQQQVTSNASPNTSLPPSSSASLAGASSGDSSSCGSSCRSSCDSGPATPQRRVRRVRLRPQPSSSPPMPPSPFAAADVQAQRPPPEPVKILELRRMAARRQSQDGVVSNSGARPEAGGGGVAPDAVRKLVRQQPATPAVTPLPSATATRAAGVAAGGVMGAKAGRPSSGGNSRVGCGEGCVSWLRQGCDALLGCWQDRKVL